MFILSTQNFAWQATRKTCPLKAIPLASLFTDTSVIDKFWVDTLEGKQPAKLDSLLCLGIIGEAWQQSPAKVARQYDAGATDASGWTTYTPKPENERDVVEVSQSLLEAAGVWEDYQRQGFGYIQGQWGDQVGEHSNLQKFYVGDFILRNQEDASDQWRVQREVYLSTYAPKA